jgi:hypothetical protein
MSDPVVVNLGVQLSETRHQATSLGRTASSGLANGSGSGRSPVMSPWADINEPSLGPRLVRGA